MIIVYCDGGWKPSCKGYGSSKFETDKGETFAHCKWGFNYPVNTNNEAEYATLLETLLFALSKGWNELKVFTDSLLVIKQVAGEWQVNAPILKKYRDEIVELIKDFDIIEIVKVPRKKIVAKLGH